MTPYNQLVEKMKNQKVFLEHPTQNIVIRYVPSNGRFYAKPKGGSEYEIHYSTDTVNECLLGGKEIAEEKYNKY